MAAKFVPVLVDSKRERALASRYSVTSTPTVVYADPEGEIAATTDDAQPAETVLADMKTALDSFAQPR